MIIQRVEVRNNMLRDEDLDLAIKLNILDESTKRKLQECECLDSCECSEKSPMELEVYKLKDVIICLTKELLMKEETIKQWEVNYSRLSQRNSDLSDILSRYRGDIHMLEQIIDKLKQEK